VVSDRGGGQTVIPGPLFFPVVSFITGSVGLAIFVVASIIAQF
jgi:hypothetical protein